MAQQIFYQPPKRRRDLDNEQVGDEPLVPSGPPSKSSEVSQDAQNTLDNIDDVLRDAEQSGGSFFNPAGDAASDAGSESSAVSPTGLETAETTAGATGANQFNFRPDEKDGSSFKDRLLSASKQNKNKLLIGGGVTGVAVGGFVALFLALIPLKIEHIVNNLESHFFASSNQAMGQETDTLLSGYIKNHIIPGLKTNRCRNTTSRDCVAVVTGSSPVAKLYAGWQQNKLETRLADEFGIEFGKDSSGRIYMKAPGLDPNGIDLSDLEDGRKATIFDYPQVSRSQARQALRDAEENLTFWDRAWTRFKVGKLAEQKYGVKRCIIACDTKDKFADKITSKKAAAKAKLVERIIEPRSANLAAAIGCFIDPNCHPEQVDTTNSNPADGTNGEAESDFDRTVRSNLDEAAASFGQRSLDQLATVLDDIRQNHNGSFSDYLVSNVLEKLGAKEVTKETVTKAIPIVGWVNLAAEATGEIKDSGPKVKKISYDINKASDVQDFMMFRTVSDEAKAGHMDATELGSFVDSLGPAAQAGGKGAGAEATPLYSKLLGDSSSAVESDGKTVLSNNRTYTCDENNKPVPKDKFICPAEDLRHNNNITSAAEIASSAVPQPVATLAGYWNATGGRVVDALGSVLSGIGGAVCSVPGVNTICDSVKSLISGVAGPLFAWVINTFFQTTITTNMSGGRSFDTLAGGADALGNDSCQHTLGCQVITPKQSAAIINQQLAEEKAAFNHQSLFARMFNTTSPYSLTSKVAMAMPTSLAVAAQDTFASLVSDPFGKLAHGIGTIFSSHGVSADVLPSDDPFGIDQYGYPNGTIPSDPEAYWNAHCQDGSQTKAWNEDAAAHLNPDTEAPQNLTTNPCLLIQSGAQSAGALYGVPQQ